jgi:uncharacterized protein YndB with AHSA1/START domain
MKNDSRFDLTVDKATKMVFITMEFPVDLSMVWDAFTNPEILDQWYAPRPMTCHTKRMDFKVGGERLYAMINPEGQERWGIQKYTSINPKTNFKMMNAFSDKDGNPQLPGSDWNLNFSEQNGTTKVNINIYNESLERLEAILEGFKVGMAMTFENLKELLATLARK